MAEAKGHAERVGIVRRFNRHYTKQLGLLHEGYLASPFSLADARVLYELAHREQPTAAELAKSLALDPGYLSRILKTFEALVATVVARFIERYDARRERCWIAEKDGEIVGSVFLVRWSRTVGQLRLLLVEPSARGLGIGARLVDECVRFGRHVGYRKITLWTNSVLRAARHIYQSAGFRLVHRERHRSFGHDLVG